MVIVSSTKTFLEVANDVLLMAGERPIASLASNPVARKVASCLSEAVLEIAILDDWSFTRDRISAISWSGDTANLGDVQRVIKVLYGDVASGLRNLRYLDSTLFDGVPVGGSVGYSGGWAVAGYGAVRLRPEPTTDEEKNKIKFDVIRALVPPKQDSDRFPLPDRFMPLVTKRALYLFVLRHLDDTALAAQYNNEFEIMVQLLRNRERYVPRGSANMYRRGR